MQKLKEAIQGKERWQNLSSYILLVENNHESNPNISLDGAKSILESISKTILEDKGIQYEPDSEVRFLVKKAFESLPVFSKLSVQDLGSAKSIIGSFENITRVIGEFRNSHGFFSHGQDLQSKKFNRYLVELTISSSDLLASFLIVSHAEDLKDRTRIYYEEHGEFNRYLDETSEEYPAVCGIQLLPSQTLFTDVEAYKEQLDVFINEKNNLITQLESSESFISTRAIASNITSFKNYFTDDELKRIVRAGINNSQVYQILGHGYTKNLFTWILEEKEDVLSRKDIDDLKHAFTLQLY